MQEKKIKKNKESRENGIEDSNVKWKNKVWEIKEYFRWISNEWIKSKTKCRDKNNRSDRKTKNK